MIALIIAGLTILIVLVQPRGRPATALGGHEDGDAVFRPSKVVLWVPVFCGLGVIGFAYLDASKKGTLQGLEFRIGTSTIAMFGLVSYLILRRCYLRIMEDKVQYCSGLGTHFILFSSITNVRSHPWGGYVYNYIQKGRLKQLMLTPWYDDNERLFRLLNRRLKEARARASGKPPSNGSIQ